MESKEAETGPINLGNPYEMTILQLAKKIIALTDSNSQIIYKELPQDDPHRRNPNIDKAIELIDWTPVIGLDDGLTRTIRYFKELLEENDASE